ncbi:MAG TPA: hypothetical protein VJM47_08690 [Nitrosospira sp.]|nr:hypothetical protein [Nitrosospira sp.]
MPSHPTKLGAIAHNTSTMFARLQAKQGKEKSASSTNNTTHLPMHLEQAQGVAAHITDSDSRDFFL